MIPENKLSTEVVRSQFLSPDNTITALTEDYERGGIAIQDPSAGLEYQFWRGYWDPDDSTVYLQPLTTGGQIPLFTQANIKEFCFTFDQNMRWCTAVMLTNGNVELRWYDTNVPGYVVTTYTGLTAFRLSLDDKRRVPTLLNITDILFTYIRDNKLYIRNQRQRFNTEYLLREDMPDNLRIVGFGMNRGWRMQWRFITRIFEEVA